MNFKDLYLRARLSNIVYETDPDRLAAEVENLGLGFIGVISAPGFQAMVATENDANNTQHIVYRGTPVTCGRDIEDSVVALGQDLGLSHITGFGGVKVLRGPYMAVRANRNKIWALVDQTKPVKISGHSLGAVEALLDATLVPRNINISVVGFGPFQAANSAFWLSAFGGRNQPIIIGREKDFAPGWNHLDMVTCHPGPIVHLINNATEIINRWPFVDESVQDHAIEDYVEDLKNLFLNAYASSLASCR